eukprot:Opistho-1_new@86904
MLPAVVKLKDGVRVGEWTITTAKGPIMNSKERDEAEARLGLPSLPEMLFGANRLVIANQRRAFELNLNAVDALDCVDKVNYSIEVRHAKKWRSTRSTAEGEEITNVVKPFDWTFSTDYRGTLVDPNGAAQVAQTSARIDLDLLRRPDPILFYDEVLLFEDELADNGMAVLTARVRVMPSCLFALQRFFLRVDDVLVRIHDTRIFHQFGTHTILREYTASERSFDELRRITGAPADAAPFGEPQFYADPAVLARCLTQTASISEEIKF